jgi:hypothetical protein
MSLAAHPIPKVTGRGIEIEITVVRPVLKPGLSIKIDVMPQPSSHSETAGLIAALAENFAEMPEDICLSIPVIQIVGERDEVWGNRILPVYAQRFPRFRQYIVPGGKIHKDVFLKPVPFYNALAKGLQESGS